MMFSKAIRSLVSSLIGITFWVLALAGNDYAWGNQQILYSFGGISYADGQNPSAALVQGVDGALYGTTAGGGTNFGGTVFKMNLDGSGYRLLHEFGNFVGDGLKPYSSLVQGQDGTLYGATSAGGTNGGGVIFRISSDGSSYSVIHEFATVPAIWPTLAILIQGTDGVLYGMSNPNPDGNKISIFKINTDGSGFMELQSLYGEVYESPGELLEGADGFLYGSSTLAGSSRSGTLFKLSRDGTAYAVLHAFGMTTNDAVYPNLLIQGPDGTLYGTSTGGGQYGFGTIFQIQPDGSGYTTLIDLPYWVRPISAIVYLPDGRLYGEFPTTDPSGSAEFFSFSIATGTFDFLRSLGGAGSLLLATNGLLYGTTSNGGNRQMGIVYQIGPSGTNFAVLHSFGTTYGNGWGPKCTLAQTADGSFYGTLSEGGTNYNGVVFRLGPDGTGYKLLHGFTGAKTDGALPNEGVVVGADSRLYGLTMRGGATNVGVLYSLNLDGSNYQVLHHFGTTRDDGYLPANRLLLGADGAFYGTAAGGWSNVGTIFRFDPSGGDYRLLHTFGTEVPAAMFPQNSTLVHDANGTLYGTTIWGGVYGGGTMFSLKPDGTQFRLLHSFGSDALDGVNPGGLLMGNDGKLYGVTVAGPTTFGAVFRSAVDGSGFTILKRLDRAFLGSSATLSQAPDGTLFGTSLDTTSGPGFAFRLNTDGSGFGIVELVGNGPSDMLIPLGALLPGIDGGMYGTSISGGTGGGTLFRLGAIPVSSPSFSLSITSSVLPDGFQVGTEATGATFLLETSTDLFNWYQSGLVSRENGLVQFFDGNQTTNSQRFYRMLRIPY